MLIIEKKMTNMPRNFRSRGASHVMVAWSADLVIRGGHVESRDLRYENVGKHENCP